jgi:hypothetical protein
MNSTFPAARHLRLVAAAFRAVGSPAVKQPREPHRLAGMTGHVTSFTTRVRHEHPFCFR